MSASGSVAFSVPALIREPSTKCTPIAPKSGPLTQGVACAKPAESAALMSLNCAVALRPLLTSGEFLTTALIVMTCGGDSAAPAMKGTDRDNMDNINRLVMLIGISLGLVSEWKKLIYRSTDRGREPR